MKYVFLAGSIIFGLTGITQAMADLTTAGSAAPEYASRVFNFQHLSISLTPVPGYVQFLLLGMGLFCLYLIWKKLKDLGMGKLTDYIPE